MLGVTYKTAWFMAHRIREAMTPTPALSRPLAATARSSRRTKPISARKTASRKAQGAGGYAHKRTVLIPGRTRRQNPLVQAGRQHQGRDRARRSATTLIPPQRLHTDGAQVYKFTGASPNHESVDHNKEYVREGKTGKVHTNTLEGFFSVFKRGMVGTYQHCGEQHLQRYLAEFDFRANHRAKLGY